MSYILDALKKAEAERQIGGVPSIHAAASGTHVQPEETFVLRRALPWLIAGLLALVILATLLWSHPWSRNDAAPAVLVPAPVQSAPAVVTEPAAAPQPAPLQEAPAPAAPAHRAASVAEKSAHGAPPVAVSDKPRAEEARPIASPSAPTSATNAASTSSPTAAAAPAPEEEAGTVRDLPESIQRELPPVAITGYLYARNPSDRSALINKKLLHEGESIAPDLVLERLTPKGAVLNFKGYHYRISY